MCESVLVSNAQAKEKKKTKKKEEDCRVVYWEGMEL